VGDWRRKLEQHPDEAPRLPLEPGPASNGEFVPALPSPQERVLRRVALARAEEAARRLGMDRRRFLQTSGGVAAVLATYNLAACGGGGRAAAPATTGTTLGATTTVIEATTSTAPGGTFTVPPPDDLEACDQVLGSQGETIVDVHTHHVVPDGPWRERATRIADMVRGLAPSYCTEDDRFRCLDRTAYLHDIFLASDTAIALLSDVPNSGPEDAPLPFDAKRETQDLCETLAGGGAPRLLLHDVIAPNFGDLQARLAGMEQTAATGDVTAFKVYTAWGPGRQGYALDDPAIGLPVVQQAHDLGIKVLCAHKGLPLLEFDRRFNGPGDLVAVSRQFPDMQFVVYHGAYERETVEGAYDPARAATGISSLVKALEDHGVAPNSNVWAEVGTTWREVLDDPTQAAHALGKLLRYVGEDRVLWGTDAIWYGSPQPQIMALRAFDISVELQERFGYPPLTPALKQKIFGGNAANLLGLDLAAARCVLDADSLAVARAEHASMVREGALVQWEPRGPMTRREVVAWLQSLRAPWRP
jgi:hypothetical protein